jgi:hypothetical protein
MLPLLCKPAQHIFEAHQWLGVNSETGEFIGVSPEELRAWGCPVEDENGWSVTLGFGVTGYKCRIKVVSGEQRIDVSIGDWIVKNPDRKFAVMPDDEFMRWFDAFTPPALPSMFPTVISFVVDDASH